jgi:anthraniloyl-CoA monooxygenase
MEFANRVVVSPLCMYSANDGVVDDWHVVHLGSRAMGGAGLVIAEMTAIHPDGRISIRDAGIWKNKHIKPWKRVVDFIHQHTEAKIGIQLGHAGRKGDTGLSWQRGTEAQQEQGFDIIGPSAIPVSNRARTPRVISNQEIRRLPQQYANAAKRALAAGFDILNFHCAHGYLMSSFISPLSNKRNDGYGGPIKNRMRLPLEIFAAIRRVWPEERPIVIRISAVDWETEGHEIEDAVVIARMFKEAGADAIDVSSGMVTNKRPPDTSLFQVPFAEQIRCQVGIPTMAVGNIENGDQMNTIIKNGQADFCVVGRGHMYDPYLVRHIAREIGHEMRWPDQYSRGANFRRGKDTL